MTSPSPGLSTIIHIGIIAYKKASNFAVSLGSGARAMPVPKKETEWKKRKKIIFSAVIIELVFVVMFSSICFVLALGFASSQSNFKIFERLVQLLT